MKQGINLGYIRFRRNTDERRSLEESASLCAEAGFYELDYMSPLLGEDYAENAKKERVLFEEHGLSVHQTHCPFLRYTQDGPDVFIGRAVRGAEVSGILGAKYMVIHGDEWPKRNVKYDGSLALEKNYEIMAPVVEACHRNNVLPAFENLFDDASENTVDGRNRFCSRGEELLALIERFGTGSAGICLDTGHGNVSAGSGLLDLVRELAPYVVCTHVHDNNFGKDMHMPAFAGGMPLEKIMEILRDNGYTGNLTWEMVYGRYPDELLPDFLALLFKSGRYLGALE